MIRWDAWSFFNNIKFLTYSEKVTDADNFIQKQKKRKMKSCEIENVRKERENWKLKVIFLRDLPLDTQILTFLISTLSSVVFKKRKMSLTIGRGEHGWWC